MFNPYTAIVTFAGYAKSNHGCPEEREETLLIENQGLLNRDIQKALKWPESIEALGYPHHNGYSPDLDLAHR